jgi:cytoskeletal protein RodZ
MSNFGASFRKAREAAGLPLDRIAAETRISTRFLLAIESEDFHLLPGGVFNRGFVRSYAERLGMDPDQAVSDYSRISASAEEPLDVLRDVERASTRKTERSLYPIAAAILLILIAVYYVVNRGAWIKPATPEPRAVESAPAATPPSEATLAPVDVPIPATPAEPVPAAPAQTSALALDVDVRDTTWIYISTDGTVVLSEVLAAGSTRRFSAERSIDIKIGNAGGATMKINGRDMGPLGGSGQVREFTITPDNAQRIQG